MFSPLHGFWEALAAETCPTKLRLKDETVCKHDKMDDAGGNTARRILGREMHALRCQAVSVAAELHCDSQPLGLVFDSAGMVVDIDPGASFFIRVLPAFPPILTK
jgi:hypothetical protein